MEIKDKHIIKKYSELCDYTSMNCIKYFSCDTWFNFFLFQEKKEGLSLFYSYWIDHTKICSEYEEALIYGNKPNPLIVTFIPFKNVLKKKFSTRFYFFIGRCLHFYRAYQIVCFNSD
jgi:hypothetical protein